MRRVALLFGLTVVVVGGCNAAGSSDEPAVGCGSPPRPATEVAATTGDFDGDGRADRAVLYDAQPERRLRIDLANRIVADDAVSVESPLWLGAADVDRDGRDEVVVAGAGFTVDGFTLARPVGCRAVEVSSPDGAVFTVSFGARGLFGGRAGGWCEDVDGDGQGELVVTTAEPDQEAIPDRNGNATFDLGDLDDRSPYRWTRQVHRIDGTVTLKISEASGRAESDPDAPELTNRFMCGPEETGQSG